MVAPGRHKLVLQTVHDDATGRGRVETLLGTYRVSIEDIVITLLWGRDPYVSVSESELSSVREIVHEDRMINSGPVPFRSRLEVSHRVQVRDVDAVRVWLGAFRAVLLHVHCEEAHLMPFDVL